MRRDLENLRAMRLAAQRDPVEAALVALAALTDDQRAEVVERFNRTFERATPPKRMTYTAGGRHDRNDAER